MNGTTLSTEASALIADADQIRTAVEDYGRTAGMTPSGGPHQLALVNDQLRQMVARHPGLAQVLDDFDDEDAGATHDRTTRYLEGLVAGAGASSFAQSLDAQRVVAAVGIIQTVSVTVLTRMAHQAA